METSIQSIPGIFWAALFIVGLWELLSFLPEKRRQMGRYVYLALLLLIYFIALTSSFVKA